MIRLTAAVVAVLVSASSPPSAAIDQASLAQAGQGTPTFRSGASLVAVSVIVTDQQRRFVSGLGPGDFQVLDDGLPQTIQFFEASQTPLDLFILIDTSSSMNNKMDTVHRAATGFLRTLRTGDRGAVVGFADRVQVVQPLTGDPKRLAAAVQETTAGGGTALNDAIYVALREFASAPVSAGDLRRRTIVVLSDGEDTSSLLAFDDVLQLARKTGVAIYTIVLQQRPPEGSRTPRLFLTQSQYALKSLAEETGAAAFFPAQVTELESVYDVIARELANQYALAYTPTSAADGRFHQIAVRTPARPELRTRARRGYTAAQGSGH